MRRLLIAALVALLPWVVSLRADPNTGVTSHWDFDEGSTGTRADVVGSDDLADFSTNVASVSGHVGAGNAARFVSGSFTILSANDSAANSMDSATFTIGSWASLHASAANDGVVAMKGDAGSYEFALSWDYSDNKWQFQVCSSGFTCSTVQWAAAPSTGTYYYLMAGHRAGSELWIKVNCGTEVTTSHTGGSSANSGQFRVGTGYYNEYYYGDVDELTTWNGVDASADCSTLYAAGAGVSYPFPMGGGGGGPRSLGPSTGVF